MTIKEKRSIGSMTQNEIMAESILENTKEMLTQLSIEMQKCIDLLRQDRYKTGEEHQAQFLKQENN